MNTAEYLNTLIECKEDMKAALIDQGAPPTGGLSTYADAIYDLYSDIVFGGLNWDEETRLTAIDSIQTYIEWTSRKVEEFIQNEINLGRNGEECFNFDDLNNSGNYWGNLYGLTFFPSTDITSNFTSMNSFFRYQEGLLTVGRIDTSKVTNMNSMFFHCYNLTSIPQMDTSKVTNMGSMFAGCENLTSIPQMDTSKVTNMGSMFSDCENITSIPELDTSKVTNMGSMFSGCKNITSIPQLDTSNVSTISDMFSNIDTTLFPGITTLMGFKNLGKVKNLVGADTFLSSCSKLTRDSILNVFNNLYDRASAGYNILTIQLHEDVLTLLSEDDIAIATNKGWTIYA